MSVIVDGEGLPIRIALTPGQSSDKEAAVPLIRSLNRARDLVADRGYEAKARIELAANQSVRAHILNQRDRRFQRGVNPATCRQRNFIKRFIDNLRHFRSVATCFDKLVRDFLAAVVLASVRLCTRAYESTT